MHVYIFVSDTLADLKKGIVNKLWAVPAMKEPDDLARLGRSRQMPVGAAGLFYCSAKPELFTTPFIVESAPEDRAIDDLWKERRYLPFSIRPIGDVSTRVLYSDAEFTWPMLKGVANAREFLNLSASLAFTATFIPRYDWDVILEQLGLDPEVYEELFSAAPGKVSDTR